MSLVGLVEDKDGAIPGCGRNRLGPWQGDSLKALIDEGLKPVVKQLPVGVGHRMLPGRSDPA